MLSGWTTFRRFKFEKDAFSFDSTQVVRYNTILVLEKYACTLRKIDFLNVLTHFYRWTKRKLQIIIMNSLPTILKS